MNRLVPVIVAMSAVAAVAAGGAVPAARAVPAAVSRAAVTGLGAPSTAGNAGVSSVSCASAGYCAAGGNGQQAFVAAELDGRWGTAAGLPGLAALNAGGQADVSSVSCASAGNCTAGGFYTDGHHKGQGFVAGEINGRWAKATGVPGLAALNAGGQADVSSVSCASAGNCAAGGFYTDGHHKGQGFVAGERHGSWSKATGVPGLAALNAGGDAGVFSVSCASAGSCAAGGFYADGSYTDGRHEHYQGFAAGERHGSWSKATGVPGLAALNAGGNARVFSVSCGSPGSCAAGGYYHDRHGIFYAFVASERNGRWGKATGVPGLAKLGLGGELSEVDSVSCGSAGSCAAGGEYYGKRGQQGFAVIERGDRWGKATRLPGLAALNTGGGAEVESVSCVPAGSCAAGGYYTGRHGHEQGFAVIERDGRWGTAAGVPGLAALNAGGQAQVYSVSCAPAGNCAAGGDYTSSNGYFQGFVAGERHGRWGTAIQMPG